MRNMSFSKTKEQIRAGTKFVTRRTGSANWKVGERRCAIEKGQGLKKGEKVVRMRVVECVANAPERVDEIVRNQFRYSYPHVHQWKSEMELEGFPNMDAEEFVEMFCELNGIAPDEVINRIEFKYVD